MRFSSTRTLSTPVDVKSIYLHDTRRILPDHFVEGEQGWVLQGVLSRAYFRRAASSGQTAFTVLSLRSLPAQFVGLQLRLPCFSAKQARILLTQHQDPSGFQQGGCNNGSGRAKPRTGDRSWLLRDFLPKPWRIERPRTAGLPSPRTGESRGAAACPFRSERRPG